jgi:hypothetical protein
MISKGSYSIKFQADGVIERGGGYTGIVSNVCDKK